MTWMWQVCSEFSCQHAEHEASLSCVEVFHISIDFSKAMLQQQLQLPKKPVLSHLLLLQQHKQQVVDMSWKAFADTFFVAAFKF